MFMHHFFTSGFTVEYGFFNGECLRSQMGCYNMNHKFKGHGQDGFIQVKHLGQVDKISGQKGGEKIPETTETVR